MQNINQIINKIVKFVNKEGEYGEYDDKPNRFTSQSRFQFLIQALKHAFDTAQLDSLFLNLKKGGHLYRTINSENKNQIDIYGTQAKGKTAHFMNSSLLGNIYIDLNVKNDSFMKLQLNSDIKLLDLRYAHHIFGSQMKGGANDRGEFNCFEEKALKYVAQIFKCQGVILYDLADMQTPKISSNTSYIAKTDAWYVTTAWTRLAQHAVQTQEIIQVRGGYLTPEIFITDTSVLDIVDEPLISPDNKISITDIVNDDNYEGKFIFKYEGLTPEIYQQVKAYTGLRSYQNLDFAIDITRRGTILTKINEYLNMIENTDSEILDLVNDKMELKSIGTKAGYKPNKPNFLYTCQKPGKNIRNVNQLKSYLFNHVLYYSKYMIRQIYTNQLFKITLLSILISWRFDYMNGQSQTSTDFRDNLKVLFNFEYNEPVQKYIKFLSEAIGNILDEEIEKIRKESNEQEEKVKDNPDEKFHRYMYYLEDAYKQKFDNFDMDMQAYFVQIYTYVNARIIDLFNIEPHKHNVYIAGAEENYRETFLMRHFFLFFLKGGTCMRMLYYSSGQPDKCPRNNSKICWETNGETNVNDALGDLSDFDYNISINAFLTESDYNLVKSMLAKVVIDVFKDFAMDIKWLPESLIHTHIINELRQHTIKKDEQWDLPCSILINEDNCENNVKLSLKDNELVEDMKGFYAFNTDTDKLEKVDEKEEIYSLDPNKPLQKHLYIQASELDFASSGAKFSLMRLMYQYNTVSVGNILSGCETQVELIDVSIIAFCALEKLDTWLHAKPKFLGSSMTFISEKLLFRKLTELSLDPLSIT